MTEKNGNDQLLNDLIMSGKQRMVLAKMFEKNSLPNKFIKLFSTSELKSYMYNGDTYLELEGEDWKQVDRDYVLSKAMLAGVEKIREMEQGEQTYSKYPNYLKRKVRENRFGIDENDIVCDPDIEKMSPMDFFKSVCEYEGLLGSYADTITSWIHDIFEIDLKEIER